MNWRRHLAKIRVLFRRRKLAEEIDEEVRIHLEMEEKENRERGMSPEEARYAALRRFGNVTQAQEQSRETWAWQWLETLLQDVRYGLRQLHRNPGFTIVAVLTLALGIGATTAMFSVIDGIILKPLPYPHPEQLVAVRLTAPGMKVKELGTSPALYFILRDQNRTFQDFGLYTGSSADVTGQGEPERVADITVTYGLLPALGVTPMLGRPFRRSDDELGSPDTVMLTYDYWQRKFGGDRAVVGKTITVNGELRQIIGVLPQRFRSSGLILRGSGLALLIPLQLDRARTSLGSFVFEGIARLKPGVTLAQADADVARLLPIMLRSFPPPPGYSTKMFEDGRIAPDLRPLKLDVVGNLGNVLWVLMGGIALVLLIACANVANLLLVRIEGRRQELAVRTALGASRSRIAAQMLVEGLMLALLSGGLGLVLADVAVRALVAIAPTRLPRLNEIHVDGMAVLFTLAVTFFVTLLIGLIPILKYTGVGLGSGLREGGRSTSESRQRHRSRSVLVTVQVALALVLLVSSGLMIRTFRAMTRVDPGFVAPSQIQTFQIAIPETKVKDPVQAVRMEQEIVQKIEAIPGVSSAGLSLGLPMDGSKWNDNVLARDHTYDPGQIPLHQYRFVSPGFFETLGTPLIAGRYYTWSDIYNNVPVAIVSEKLAREYWGDPRNALGKQIRSTTQDDWAEVIGVVGDVHGYGVDKPAPSSVYWPILFHFGGKEPTAIRWVKVSIRSPRAGSQTLMNEVRRAVWSVDSDLPLTEVHTLEYYERTSMARTSFTLVILALAGCMALLLAIVGLYGVISYSVSQRMHEMGIRAALGAQHSDIMGLVIGQGFKLMLAGVAIGIVGALALTRFLSSLLYGVTPTDPLTFIAVSLILIAVALLACYIPARRAAKVDPMIALRYE